VLSGIRRCLGAARGKRTGVRTEFTGLFRSTAQSFPDEAYRANRDVLSHFALQILGCKIFCSSVMLMTEPVRVSAPHPMSLPTADRSDTKKNSVSILLTTLLWVVACFLHLCRIAVSAGAIIRRRFSFATRCRAGWAAIPHQLDTKRIELLEFSRTAAATLPKNSASPAGRPTPMTIRL
jgi:hypothetical protein